MKYLSAIGMLVFLWGCNNPSTENKTMAVVEEAADAKRELPVFTGEIDSTAMVSLMRHYFAIKNALIDGNADAASKTAQMSFSEFVNTDDAVLLQLKSYLKQIGAETKLEKQREIFYPLSEYVYAVTLKQKPDTATLYKQYCPMAFNDKGAWWISDENEVVNPYFGEEMLHCGMVQEAY